MDASQLSDLSGKMEEEEERFTPSECSSELEEMFNAPSEMPEEQSVSELAHDDVGIIEKSSVSPKNREGMPTGSGILDEYSTSSPSVDNRLPEANIADEISPPPHAVKPLSPEASKDSEDLNQLDILKGQTAVADQVANKIPEVPLFQIMKIVSDKQELSFVDKVHLPAEQILGLCNRVLPNSADNHEYPDIRIDFKSLNQVSLPTVGFYGDKRTMGRILKEMGAIDDSIHKQMEEEKFEAGLYVGRLEQVIIVFYWHQETHLKDASRKNVSCNFIRYVVDLCDDVYVCVEDHNLLAATPADSVVSGTTSLRTRPRRTEKLKIGRVRNSENDVTVSSGFHLNIGRHISTMQPSMPKQTMFFAEGYHRCAFLTPNYRGSRKYVKPQKKNGQVAELASELQTLSKGYDLDYTRLSNADFASLLKHATLPESQSYTELKDSFRVLRAENQKLDIQSELNKLVEQILQNFLHVLPEYCSFIRYLSDSESEESGRVAAQKIDQIQKNPFQQLENQLATIWNGKYRGKKLLFVGSDIKFRPTDGRMDTSFIVERSGKSAHPVMLEEEVMLRCTDKVNKPEKARFTKSGVNEKLPVLSGEQLILKFQDERTLTGTLEVSKDAPLEGESYFDPKKLVSKLKSSSGSWGRQKELFDGSEIKFHPTDRVDSDPKKLVSKLKSSSGSWGRQKELFDGSEIKFHPTDRVDSRDSAFIVRRSGTSSDPIMLEEEIMLEDKGGHKTEKARFSKSGVTEKRPVVPGEQLILKVESERTLQGLLEVSADALREWVKSFVPKRLLTLSQNIVFLGFLLSNGISEQMKSFGQPIINKLQEQQWQRAFTIEKRLLLAFLTSNAKLDQVKNFSNMEQFLTSGSLDNILAEIENGKADWSPELQESCVQWKRKWDGFKLDEHLVGAVFANEKWKNLCSSTYENANAEFRGNILSMIMKDIQPRLMSKLESQKKANETLQEQQLKTKEENFLTETKKKLSQRRDNGKRMYITSCSIPKEKYTLEISSEEEEKPNIQWMIVELPPNKKDIDELNLNPRHCIIPSCSNPFELVCCDPEIEDLKKVAYLKSGELLVFLHDKEHNRLDLYMSPKIGQFLHGRNLLHSFKRGFDLVAFDERTRFLALYDAQGSKVVIYKFDESFRNIDWTGVEIMLSLFSGSTNIKWMQCVPGKAELVLVDDTNRLRVAELHHRPLMKPKSMTLSSDFLNAFISGDGSFLFVFHTLAKFSDQKEECASSSAQGAAQENKPTSEFELKVYMLGDAMSFLKNISLNINVEDVRDLQVKLVYYGSQIHLVVYSDVVPSFSSKILNLVSATEALEFEELGKQKSTSERDHKNAMDRDSQNTSSATLDYIYHIFDKFAVDPALFRGSIRDLNFHVLLKSRDTTFGKDRGQGKYEEYLKNVIGRLKREKGKDFSNLRIQFKVQMSESCDLNSLRLSLPHNLKKPLGNWVRQLICLVPVQITRAESNGLQPLLDGLQIPPHFTYADSISLATLLRFGLYDAVLSQWDGKIKVVSSMGKQSSGKSFLLNHLSGSLFDVAGGRCTDGVWMTVRTDSECLYVLMEFEGLGSFERTEQEDMLLSVLNAALSNLTIFNKKDFHLDEETEVIFQRFQSGVSLVKEDKKLFKGVFYIAIKDVDVSDVEELKDEFRQKLLKICQRSRENFLTKMYGGVVELVAMAPFTRREYHQECLFDIALTVEELGHSYESGRAFLTDLKLVMSQIALKDWTSVDMKRVAMKVDILRGNLVSAVKAGCISVAGVKKMLTNFDSQEEVSDAPLVLWDLSIDLQDTGLELAPLDESTSKDRILSNLRSILDGAFDRRGKTGDLWHSKFQGFIEALAARRYDRVQRWLRCNTAEFSGNDDVQKLQLEAVLALAELKQGLSVCGCKCSDCFWRCVLEKGHSSDHSCMGNHVCAEKCTYCSLELHQDQENEVEECKHLAGHEGNHDCKMKNHTCAEICSLFDKSSNCSKSCCLTVGHEGTHKCNSSQHLCNMECSLPSCKNPCVIQIELGDHDKHACHERFCPKDCIMEGCPRSCGYKDHFHELTSDEHLCGEKHGCPKECEADGICEILTELVLHTRSFQRRRGSFEYIHLSEQNGKKKNCCIDIPPFKTSHDGVHLHTQNPDAVHHCNARCQACGCFCLKPIDHIGLHNTVHGNMRNVNYASDQEEFDIQGRKYAWGESSVAEMCNLHCKAQGRGHIHLIPCPMNDGWLCTSHIYDGSRHETRKYGPDVDVPKDELTHETYWMQMRFEDPCTEEDQHEFALCNHLCRSEEHKDTDGSSTKSYCAEKLWHAPVQRTSTPSSGGHITADGHRFLCDHLKNVPHHVVFVIDRSGSMSTPDIRPNLAKCIPRHNCRLGCVYESIDRFIKTRLRTSSDDSVSVVLFDDTATLALERQEMKEDIVDGLLQYDAWGATSYSSGLTMAEEVICRGSNDPNVEKKKPIIIFLSGGGNNDGQDPLFFVNKLKKTEPKLILHTIMYGTDPAAFILEKMAEIGNGTFHLSLDELQLARSFENLEISLEPNVVSVIPASRSNP